MARNMLTENRHLNFVQTLNAIFYVTKLFGIVPYSMKDYHYHKKITVSILGNIISIICIFFYFGAYHLAVTSTYFDGTVFNSGEFLLNIFFFSA